MEITDYLDASLLFIAGYYQEGNNNPNKVRRKKLDPFVVRKVNDIAKAASTCSPDHFLKEVARIFERTYIKMNFFSGNIPTISTSFHRDMAKSMLSGILAEEYADTEEGASKLRYHLSVQYQGSGTSSKRGIGEVRSIELEQLLLGIESWALFYCAFFEDFGNKNKAAGPITPVSVTQAYMFAANYYKDFHMNTRKEKPWKIASEVLMGVNQAFSFINYCPGNRQDLFIEMQRFNTDKITLSYQLSPVTVKRGVL